MELTEAIIRIMEAFLVSCFIGIDREKTKRPAGLRTHVIVALGACLVTIAPLMYATEGISMDVTRLAAQVISGIGFLGAGTILRYRENVIGLTTAASLWASACLGVAAGLGAHAITILTGLLIITVLKVVPYIERRFFNKNTEFHIIISMKKDQNDLMAISQIMKEKNINIKSVNIELDENERKVYKFNLIAKDVFKKDEFMLELYKIDLLSLQEYEDFDN